ncbi:sugar phosphate isomerase/epimerase [Sphingomonas sp. S1-29]|uniref:sugar phosphate isomerase/epimerase family protein n=1 Tax=Sphingomonas sp. S1-29 TaxID=2991074 RepID=UPI00223F48D1|nr:sugar phosphate isomerase/epimerase [Sphingomonas sp. S1-29]UZK68609.1 sugar phosphate isomerase/epimerase [Sphingomonas sp. S1-29]
MNLNRRQILGTGAALTALAAAGPAFAQPKRAIGIQLYTVRELFGPDPMGTLEKIAKIGYREVEFGGGGYDKMDHAALRRRMDRLGLKSPSIHVPYEMLLADFDGAVKMAKTLGADTIILPYMTEPNRTLPVFTKAIADFSRFAERLKKLGLDFAYHNHDFEFTLKPEGRSLYERLIADTDPALVKIELDLFWTIAAGVDPKALIRSMPGRIYAYHVKDRTADGKMTSVGKGTIDFADIFTLNDIAGVRHFYVENDQSPAPYLPDITTSFQTLSRLRA